MKHFVTSFAAAMLAFLLFSCGNAKSAGQARGERVFTDQSGFVCFIVRDENGSAVGGNCVKE